MPRDAAGQSGASGPSAGGLPAAPAIAFAAGLVLLIVGLVTFGSWTGPGGTSQASALIVVLTDALPWAALWLGAAWGLGWYLRHFLFRTARSGRAMQGGVGVAALLWTDATLGTLGLLTFPIAILIVALGWSGVVAQCRRTIMQSEDGSLAEAILPPWTFWLMTPALIALIGAATVAPGWIWGSEFGGYDALSYHLQLPREWLAAGSIQTLDHNVYSALPGFMESAYLHLMVLHPGAASLYSCQLIHAACAVMAACAAGSAARTMCNDFVADDESRHLENQSGRGLWQATVAGGLLIGTPWVVVTGSLAYNECAVVLMLATAMVCIADNCVHTDNKDGREWRPLACGCVLALLCGAAIGAKLTSVFFVLVPVTSAALLLRPKFFARPSTIAAALVVGLAVLSPWLFRNWDATSNPVFPFATGIFGSGHWSNEQVALWAAGHSFDGSMSERMTEGWRQFFQFGIGPNPYAGTQEPWTAQWIVLPWLAMAGCLAGLLKQRTRRMALALSIMMLIQLLAWLTFTHIKSRFMLPFVVPGAMAATLLLPSVRMTRPALASLLAPIVLLWSAVPLLILRSEQDGRPAVMIGGADLRSGDGLSAADRSSLARTTFPECLVNHELAADASVLLVGEAAPLYYTIDRVTYCTVWDRGLISAIIADTPNDPGAWAARLRAEGFTHVLVDPTMLSIWRQSGWGDALLDAQVIMSGFGSVCSVEAQYDNGTTIFRLPSSAQERVVSQ